MTISSKMNFVRINNFGRIRSNFISRESWTRLNNLSDFVWARLSLRIITAICILALIEILKYLIHLFDRSVHEKERETERKSEGGKGRGTRTAVGQEAIINRIHIFRRTKSPPDLLE